MEDYEKKYKEALGRANAKIETYNHLGNASVVKSICEIFPELKESEDEKIRKWIRNELESKYVVDNIVNNVMADKALAWLEKQSTPQVRKGNEWVNIIDDACEHRYAEEYAHGEYCHQQSFRWGFQEGVDWLEKQDQKKHEEELENAYKCADEVQYRRGYEDAKHEFKKQGEKVDVIKNFNTEFERQISHLIASTINKEHKYNEGFVKWAANALLNYAKHELEEQVEHKPQDKPALEVWKDMRLEVYQQASGNRHEPNYSDDSTKMFSLTDIDEIIDKIDEKQGEQKHVVVPRFRVGDVIRPKGSTAEYTIESISEGCYHGKGWGLFIGCDEDYELVEHKFDENVESKFKPGDWIVYCNETVVLITGIKADGYIINKSGYIPFTCQGNMRLWTIQDAKDGDVLASDGGNVCLFDGTVEEGIYPFAYCGITRHGFEFYDRKLPFTHDYVYPANELQRDLLFQKMKEAGYEWDSEKKELTKIEQKPAWSEEDERNLEGIINEIEANKNNAPDYDLATYDRFLSWLKSLKDRVQPQPKQEWSEEDKGNLLDVKCIIDEVWHNQNVREEIDHSGEELESLWHWLDNIWQKVAYPESPLKQTAWSEEDEKMHTCCEIAIDFFKNLGKNSSGHPHPNYFDLDEKIYPERVIDWLKSLKERYTWKPSNEQMEIIYKYSEQNNYDGSVLTSLYRDLKKLREE